MIDPTSLLDAYTLHYSMDPLSLCRSYFYELACSFVNDETGEDIEQYELVSKNANDILNAVLTDFAIPGSMSVEVRYMDIFFSVFCYIFTVCVKHPTLLCQNTMVHCKCAV